MIGSTKINVIVSQIKVLNEMVTCFEFKRTNGGLLPTFSGGAHTIVEMQDGSVLRLNPYSIMSDPFEQARYTISVRRDDQGRGGSLFMHTKVKVGDEMVISYPVNLFSLDLRARKHLFIAGGIGITPFLAQIKQLERSNGYWELHYSTRRPSLGTFVDELLEKYPHKVSPYYDESNQKIELTSLLSGQPLGTHIYICGPKGMIDWVRQGASDFGWPDEAIHFEEFLAPLPGKPFQAKLKISDKVINVGELQSLLEAVELAGVEAPYLCRGGACGQCETSVIEYDGRFIHRDHWLTDDERASGLKIMPCVSRFEGKKLVLDR
jgi:dimethylamine monooxygenase subunit B